MRYRTLLAYLPEERTAPAVLQAAVALAEAHEAHLLGVHVLPPLELYGSQAALPTELERSWLRAQAELAERLRAEFERHVAAADVVGEFRVIEDALNASARCVVEIGDTTDLLILPHVGRSVPGRGDHERIITLSARPAVLLPADGTRGELNARRVLVAWDGSREASGAVFGALPLLARAEEVRVYRLNPPGGPGRGDGPDVDADLVANLARHGVDVELVRSAAPAGGIGRELLRCAADMEADLMVMGCYGHAKLRELLLGGTTRQVLGAATIPLLLHG